MVSAPWVPQKPPSPTPMAESHFEEFQHVVGGHTSFLCRGQHLYKRAIMTELYLYENIRENMALREFLPRYYGTAVLEGQTTAEEDSWRFPEPLLESRREAVGSATSTGINSRQGRSRSPDARDLRSGMRRIHSVDSLEDRTTEVGSLRRQRSNATNLNRYLVLENLAWRLKYPCVLDVKIGVRQHGDDEPPDKQRRKAAKCRSSTSSTLGVRVHGMKVYKTDQGNYEAFGKEYGRSLTEATVINCLRKFLDPGRGIRTDVAARFVQKLRDLEACLRTQVQFRFYATSLLFVYDADSVDGTRALVRMIDFAHASLLGSVTPEGEKNQNQTTTTAEAATPTAIPEGDVLTALDEPGSGPAVWPQRDAAQGGDDTATSVPASPTLTARAAMIRAQVESANQGDESRDGDDVSVMSVNQSVAEDIGEEPSGPDEGFLLGVASLIRLFSSLLPPDEAKGGGLGDVTTS
eukprot:CAMPEP_0114561370 /NCGR_PEP_ID=MMETSP0114-20121206/11968_1 /TAXON_ID=31324 /ORGANISM="Goniomonas sp, Strain m" /LENGTH=463 /DNA_ID=CAMNT_0001747001 /DNA_START=54 /DNA_END=1442 /DNA_ORIENTATION=-